MDDSIRALEKSGQLIEVVPTHWHDFVIGQGMQADPRMPAEETMRSREHDFHQPVSPTSSLTSSNLAFVCSMSIRSVFSLV